MLPYKIKDKLIYFLCYFAFVSSSPCVEEVQYDSRKDTPNFSNKHIMEFKRFGDFLEEKTSKDDFVVFVGRSPYLTKYYWDVNNTNRNYISVSYSGTAYDPYDSKQFPTDAQLEKYEKYLTDIGFSNKIKNTSKIVLVDFTVTGSGLWGFTRLIFNVFNKDIDNKSVSFVCWNVFFPSTKMEHIGAKFETFSQDYKQCKFEFIPFSSFGVLDNSNNLFNLIISNWEFSIQNLSYFPHSYWDQEDKDPSKITEEKNVEHTRSRAIKVWKGSPL